MKGATAAAAGTLVPGSVLADDTLNILVWCDHADQKLIGPFEDAHNVTVNVKTYEGTGTALSILEQSAPGDWDVIVIDAPDVPQVAGLGILDELPDDLAPWDDIFPTLRNAPYTRVDGKVYAVPEKFGYYGFCYNRDVVDAADVRRGDIAWNDAYSGRIGVYDYYFPVLQMIGLSMGLKPADITVDHLGDIRERLLAMKPNVKMIGDIVSVQNALVTKSVDVVVGGAEFTVSNLMGSNPHLDWTISDDGGLIWNQGIGILSDSNRKELASLFLQWILSPKARVSWRRPSVSGRCRPTARRSSPMRRRPPCGGTSRTISWRVPRRHCCPTPRSTSKCSTSGRSSSSPDGRAARGGYGI